MKIEIVSGTKDEPPMGRNTIIKMDGKEVKMVNYLKFSTEANGVAYWHIGFRTNRYYENLIWTLKKIGHKLGIYKRKFK